MIRKIIIAMLAVAASAAGLVRVVGGVQAYLDPAQFHNASDRPDLYWLQGRFDITDRLSIASYRGSLGIHYYALPIRGWYATSDRWIYFPGFSINTVRRCPLVLSSSTGPPAGTMYQTAGWSASVSFLPIALLFGAYPLFAFIRGPLRRHRRHKRGLCVTCAYDLRGSPERCPECGSEVRAR